jgi:hypothetical protein
VDNHVAIRLNPLLPAFRIRLQANQ